MFTKEVISWWESKSCLVLVLKSHPVVKLAEIVHGPIAVVVPPVAIVRWHRHTVLPPPSIRLAWQEVLAPLEVGDLRPVVEEVQALRPQVVDAQPHRPVPRVEEGLDVVSQGLLLLAVAGHRHAASSFQALSGCSSVVLIAVIHQITFVSHPAPLLASWKKPE